MPVIPPDFTALDPVGFQSVLWLRQSFTGLQDGFAYLNSSDLIALASDDKSIGEGSTRHLYDGLLAAMQTFHQMSAIPVAPLRDVSNYSDLFCIIVPKDSALTLEVIADALQTAVSLWQIPDPADYNSMSEAINSRLNKLGMPIEAVRAAFLTITDAMNKQLNSLSVSDSEALSGSLFDTLAGGLQSLTTVSADVDGRVQLNSTLGLQLTATDFGMTFAQLIKADKKKAQGVLTSLLAFNATVKVHLTRLSTMQNQVSGLVAAYSGILTAMTNVPIGIDRFSQSLTATSTAPPLNPRDDAVKAWALVGQNAKLYMQDLGGATSVFPPNVSTTQMARKARAANSKLVPANAVKQANALVERKATDPVTPGDVRDAFGSPANATTLLPDMTASTGQIVDAFDKLLQVPYGESLKITNDDGSEVAVRDTLVQMKAKYETLQAKTIPVTRNLYACAVIQEQLIPTINQPNGITLDLYLQASLEVVLTYGKASQSIANETTSLRDEFQRYLDLLSNNLKNMEKQIDDLETSVRDKEAEYEASLISSIIQGILFAGFTLATVLVVVGTLGGGSEVALALGIAAGASLVTLIEDSIKAGRLADDSVISNLRTLLDTCKATKEQLEGIIPMFSKIVQLMTAIGDIWKDINSSLENIRAHELLWENPAFFTASMVLPTLQSWSDVGDDCVAYARVIGGYIPARDNTLQGDAIVSNAGFLRAMTQDQPLVEDPPPEYREFEKYPVVVRRSLEQDGHEKILDFLSAPPLVSNGLRKSDLLGLAATWIGTGKSLNDMGFTALANDCTDLGNKLNDVIPTTMAQAVLLLLTFASAEPALPTLPVNATDWQMFCQSENSRLANGKEVATMCEASLRNLQNRASYIYSACQAKQAELQIQRDRKQSELDDAQSTYDSYRWLIFVPTLIAIFLEQLIESIRHDQDEINNLQGQINQLNGVMETLTTTTRLIQQLFDFTRNISTFWGGITTKVTTAANLWILLEKFPDQEMKMAKQTWAVLENAFQDWK